MSWTPDCADQNGLYWGTEGSGYYTGEMKNEYSTGKSLDSNPLSIDSLDKLTERAEDLIRQTLRGNDGDSGAQKETECDFRTTSSHWYQDPSGSRIPLRHLDDSDLALSQEIFIRRCQGQEKLDFRDLLTPEMRQEAQRLLSAKCYNVRKYLGLED